MVLCPIAGLVLGLVQMTPDMRRGRWQFLNHRPVSRGSLLLGKILAGFMLYFLSAGVPLALVIVWVATPGHIPGPFSSNMIGPNLAKFFAGFPWYAAGLLVAARRGRWVGSRLVPIGGAVAAVFFCNIFPRTVPESVVNSIIFTALILTAPRGAYITGGEMAPSSAWAKVSLAFTLIAGWGFLIVILALFAQAAAGPNFRPWTQAALPSQWGSYQSIGLGNGVWLHISTGMDSGATLPPAPDNHASVSPLRNVNLGINSTKLTELFNPWNSNWFYVWQRQTVEGYDRKTCKFLGSLGPAGFLEPSASPQPFPEPMESGQDDYNLAQFGLLIWPDVIYRLTLSAPAVHKIFVAAPGDPVISAYPLWYRLGTMEDMQSPDGYVGVRTSDRVHILHGAHEAMALPVDGKSSRSDIAVAMTDSGRYILAYLSEDRGRKTIFANTSFYNADGKLEHLSRKYDFEPMIQQDTSPETDWLRIYGFTAFSPLPLIWVVQSHQFRGDAVPWWVITICAISLICGGAFCVVAASLLRARHAFRWSSYFWTALCALLGLPAILALLSIEDHPRATSCHTCGKRRLLTEPKCPHCGAPAAPPEIRGIEILEPALLGS
jgi:hypothetical protein